MKRQTFTARVGEETRTASTWNAAIRASEAMVREIARAEGQMYAGYPPVLVETRRYNRTWQGVRTGDLLLAEVTE